MQRNLEVLKKVLTSHSVVSIELYNRVTLATDRRSKRRKAGSPTTESIWSNTLHTTLQMPQNMVNDKESLFAM